jgi:hypothetical protein
VRSYHFAQGFVPALLARRQDRELAALDAPAAIPHAA